MRLKHPRVAPFLQGGRRGGRRWAGTALLTVADEQDRHRLQPASGAAFPAAPSTQGTEAARKRTQRSR